MYQDYGLLIDDVYARANSSGLGRAAYVFTKRSHPPARGGMGREGGAEGIHDYLNVKLTQTVV